MADHLDLRGRTLSVSTAAKLLGVSDDTVRRLIHDGDVISIRVRAQHKVLRSSLERYLAEQMAIPAHDSETRRRVTAARRSRNAELQPGEPGHQLELLEG